MRRVTKGRGLIVDRTENGGAWVVLTAKRRDRSVDGLDKDTLPVQLRNQKPLVSGYVNDKIAECRSVRFQA